MAVAVDDINPHIPHAEAQELMNRLQSSRAILEVDVHRSPHSSVFLIHDSLLKDETSATEPKYEEIEPNR